MREVINEEVSVVMVYSAKKRLALPHIISWNNQEYKVNKVSYYHWVKVGDNRHHIYELTDRNNAMWFRLNLDSSNLHWKLEAVSDGLAT